MFKIVNESATLQCEKDGRGICDVVGVHRTQLNIATSLLRFVLRYLVWELVSHIAQEFNPQDLFNFFLSCRTL
ncbi:uncharacterized protein PgNI_01108 [Pyricularia grisea]|uniref:Uncharacterized protein n=1 Tax=Pyricularia grisea TaxID=148305 RepID=A0A6P8BM17_PYRGI|nr:uncharacterized protein PgNI_01108 [Pyricularia grisea]TLD17858.1 hypothetical protein PgNI_01108 [Pyricularia grisea]